MSGEFNENNQKGYRKLRVFHAAHKLIIETYKVTEKFPKGELFGLVSQMRRSAVSVAANIIEGHARSRAEFKRFLSIANGSLVELEYYLELVLELGYINKQEYNLLDASRIDAGMLLGGLLKSLKKHPDS